MILKIVFIIVGLLFCYMGLTFILFLQKVKQWPKVRGILMEKHLGDPKQLSGDSFSNQRVYVVYKYEVQGKQYSGNKLYSLELLRGERSDLKKKARRILENLDEQPEVHYKPDNPEISFLQVDKNWMGWLVFVSGAVCLITGVSMLFY